MCAWIETGSELTNLTSAFRCFRCVDEKDKPVAMGFGLMLMSFFAFIPSPIFFGYVIGEFLMHFLVIQ